MEPTQFWQNFQLGFEQEIACNFIYDGLKSLHDMDSLNRETEIFPVLYNLSIGIERLLKVAVILLEFNDQANVKDLEKSLTNHNHIALLNRIQAQVNLKLGDNHIAFLELLFGFYNTYRYDRFNLESVCDVSKEKKALYAFLEKFLEIDISNNVFGGDNSLRIKKFIGRAVKKISRQLHTIIEKTASAKNLYTYEISGSSSKAAKVLWGDKDILFEDEEIAIIEILIFFLNSKNSSLINAIKSIVPLDLDPALSSDYLQLLLKKRTDEASGILEEIEERYREISDRNDRIEMIKALKKPGIFFEEDNDLDELE